MRIVLDTNLIVSALISRDSRLASRLWRIIETHDLVYSEATMAELDEVLHRRRLARYVTAAEADALLELLRLTGTEIRVTRQIKVCRDPKDDKVLALAVSGKADAILTGDDDLLVLDPFEGVRIFKIAAFGELDRDR